MSFIKIIFHKYYLVLNITSSTITLSYHLLLNLEIIKHAPIIVHKKEP